MSGHASSSSVEPLSSSPGPAPQVTAQPGTTPKWADAAAKPQVDATVLSPLDSAILRAVAYSDVFDYPLNDREVHRFLVGVAASLPTVQDALHNGHLVPGWLSYHRGHFTMPGRKAIVETRVRRSKMASRLWPLALRYGRAIASLPFVRMVAVTGTLAMNNVDPDADIDYLIVTEAHRLWLARSLSIALVYVGRLERLTICPNYVISLDALEEFEHSLFTAHELAQMVPLHGLSTYRQLIQANDWARRYLPNAFDAERERVSVSSSRASRILKRSMEVALAGALGNVWERRESRAKMKELNRQAQDCGADATTFSPQMCKGHLDDHGTQTARAYAQRLELLGLAEESIHDPSPDSGSQ